LWACLIPSYFFHLREPKRFVEQEKRELFGLFWFVGVYVWVV
jgi:hypothetical protein